MQTQFRTHDTRKHPLFPAALQAGTSIARHESAKTPVAVRKTTPPACKTYMVHLPNTSLHVMEAGHGAPLIMVPATISELENWRSLVQFMAQWYRVYFFELPGHGKSQAFREPFTTDRVAETVEQLADHLGIERFSLMGFSFGGILAIKSYKRLESRVERLILNAPCVTSQAVNLSRSRRRIVHHFIRVLRSATFRMLMTGLLKSRFNRVAMVKFFQLAGKLENGDKFEQKLAEIGPVTMDVLSRELEDILTIKFSQPVVRHTTPCHLAMSVHDPLLDFQTTLDELRSHFETVHVTRLYFPYHQPPEPFSFQQLNRDYAHVAQSFVGTCK